MATILDGVDLTQIFQQVFQGVGVAGQYNIVSWNYLVPVTITQDYQAVYKDLVRVDTSSNPVTITLPPMSSEFKGLVVAIKLVVAGNTLTIDGYQSDTIDGVASRVLTDVNDSMYLIADGASNWFVMASTSGGAVPTGNTLGNAYNEGGAGLGRFMVTSNGAIEITNPNGSNNNALDIINNEVTNNNPSITLAGTSSKAGNIESTVELKLKDQHLSAAIPVSQLGTAGLSGFTATSIVKALNELKSDIGSISISLQDAYNGGYGITTSGNPLQITVPDTTNSLALDIINNEATNHTPSIRLSGSSINAGSIINDNIRGLLGSFGSGSYTGIISLDLQATHNVDDVNADALLSIVSQTTNATALSSVSIDALGDNAFIDIGGNGSNKANIRIGFAGTNHNIQIGSLTPGIVTDLDILANSDIEIASNNGNIEFEDQYLSAAIPLSETGTTGLMGFTATSIVGALNEARLTGGDTFDSCYNNDSGERTVTINDGDVVWDVGSTYGFHVDNEYNWFRLNNTGSSELGLDAVLRKIDITFSDTTSRIRGNNADLTFVLQNAASLNVDLTTTTNTTDGFHVENGADFYRLNYGGTDLLDLTADLRNLSLLASGSFAIENFGSMVFKPKGAAALFIDIAQVAGASDGLKIQNGSDIVQFLKAGTNLMNVQFDVNAFQINSTSSIILNPFGASAIAIELANLAGASDGLKIQYSAGDYWHFLRGASANQVNVVADINNMSIAGSGAFDINPIGDLRLDTTSGQILIGHDSVNMPIYMGYNGIRSISIGNTNTTTALDLRAGTGGIDQTSYGDIDFLMNGASSVIVNTASISGTADGFEIKDSLFEYFRVIKKASSALDLETALQNITLSASNDIKIGASASEKIGLFGATSIIQPTTATYGVWTTLANVVAALQALGILGT